MMKNKRLAAVGFQPTPPKRLVPKTSALDHSATLPDISQKRKSKSDNGESYHG